MWCLCQNYQWALTILCNSIEDAQKAVERVGGITNSIQQHLTLDMNKIKSSHPLMNILSRQRMQIHVAEIKWQLPIYTSWLNAYKDICWKDYPHLHKKIRVVAKIIEKLTILICNCCMSTVCKIHPWYNLSINWSLGQVKSWKTLFSIFRYRLLEIYRFCTTM